MVALVGGSVATVTSVTFPGRTVPIKKVHLQSKYIGINQDSPTRSTRAYSVVEPLKACYKEGHVYLVIIFPI